MAVDLGNFQAQLPDVSLDDLQHRGPLRDDDGLLYLGHKMMDKQNNGDQRRSKISSFSYLAPFLLLLDQLSDLRYHDLYLGAWPLDIKNRVVHVQDSVNLVRKIK